MNSFDALVDSVDAIQQETFGTEFTFSGSSEVLTGIFDEKTDDFEGVGTAYRTLEIPFSVLPEDISNGSMTVYLIDSDRTFTVHDYDRIGSHVTIELR